jgi:hypothetical protein
MTPQPPDRPSLAAESRCALLKAASVAAYLFVSAIMIVAVLAMMEASIA